MTKHTILFLAANPSSTDRLALDQEARSIQVEIERSRWRDRLEFVTRWATEPLDVIREMRRLRPTVVHFSGHGSQDGVTDRHGSVGRRDVGATGDTNADEPCPGLYFHGADGSPRIVSTAALRDAFGAAGTSVKLVVLNACYSETAANALLTHVDYVVGMAGSIRDDAARSFAIGFYGSLGDSESVDSAYKGGCAAIGLDGFSDSDRPWLRMRGTVDPDAMILTALAPETPKPAATDVLTATRYPMVVGGIGSAISLSLLGVVLSATTAVLGGLFVVGFILVLLVLLHLAAHNIHLKLLTNLAAWMFSLIAILAAVLFLMCYFFEQPTSIPCLLSDLCASKASSVIHPPPNVPEKRRTETSGPIAPSRRQPTSDEARQNRIGSPNITSSSQITITYGNITTSLGSDDRSIHNGNTDANP